MHDVLFKAVDGTLARNSYNKCLSLQCAAQDVEYNNISSSVLLIICCKSLALQAAALRYV